MSDNLSLSRFSVDGVEYRLPDMQSLSDARAVQLVCESGGAVSLLVHLKPPMCGTRRVDLVRCDGLDDISESRFYVPKPHETPEWMRDVTPDSARIVVVRKHHDGRDGYALFDIPERLLALKTDQIQRRIGMYIQNLIARMDERDSRE